MKFEVWRFGKAVPRPGQKHKVGIVRLACVLDGETRLLKVSGNPLATAVEL